MQPSPNFRQQRQFLRFARELVRLPRPGEGPLEHLLPESRWRELCRQAPDPEAWLAALSQATGVYFFPSREWVRTLMRYLQRLRVPRLLEAGAGRGYLTAALAPLCAATGIVFRAVDRGEGEFTSGLPIYPGVERAEVFQAVQDFRPDVVLYAWPPPGQSLAAICQTPFVYYLIVVGEAGTGVTGSRADWEQLRHQVSPALSRYGRGRTGAARHRVTIFYGGRWGPDGKKF